MPKSLTEFPGTIPPDLDAAYLCQEMAIKCVARPADRLEGRHDCAAIARRFSEPIAWPAPFSTPACVKRGEEVEFPVFVGGFAAVEAEFVLRIAHDAPTGKVEWTGREAQALVGVMHIGVETAGSPLATINELGPTAIAADFGNNAGLILGPEIRDWAAQPHHSFAVVTSIEGKIVGRGEATLLSNGPIGGLQFLAGQTARMGRPLKAGMLVSTGAITGVHDIKVGQSAVADFGSHGRISCFAVAAEMERA